MLHRFKHYHRNMGNRDTVINLIVVAYLCYVFLRNGIDSVAIILGGSVFLGALVPRLFLNAMVKRPGRTVRIMRTGQIALIVLLIVNFTGLWSAPPIVWLVLCPLLGALLGMGFWLFSDPRILTQQGYFHYHAYADGYDTPEPDHTASPPLAR